MKTIPLALMARKASPAMTACYLLRVGPTKDGQTYGFASTNVDVTYDDGAGAIVYRARTGLQWSAFVSTSDLSVDNAEAQTLPEVFGVPGVSQADIDNGYFDNVPFVLYMVDFEHTADGHEMMASGTVGRAIIKGGGLAVLELRSLSQQLKQSIGDLTSLTCRCKYFGSQVGDERFPCLYDITGEWVTFTVSAQGDEPTRQFNAAGLTQAQDWFAPGLVEWLTGANAGAQAEVQAFGPTPTRFAALLHFDGTNGSTTFTDDTGRSWAASGDVKISTTSAKLGTGCLLLDGNLDYISTADHVDFQFGAGMFTVQAFVRFATAAPANAALVGKWGGTTGARSWVLYLNAGTLYFRFSDTGGTLRDCSIPWSPAANTWYHVAASRDASGVVRLFVDGTVVATATLPQALNAGTNGVRIGHANDLTSAYYVNGRMDEVGISKGLCLYASAFTPPAVPLALRTGGDVTQLFTLPNAIAVGDTGRIRRDCTREWTGHNSCETYWGTSKGLHFRGEPHLQPGDPVQVPGAET